MSSGILLATAQELREFSAQAAVPAHFFSVFSDSLEMTASPKGDDGLDALLDRYELVGIDIELLLDGASDTSDMVRYRRNLAQKLCGRSVVGLWVVKEPSWQGETHWTLRRSAESRMGESPVGFCSEKTTPTMLADMIRPLGARLGVEPAGSGARLVLEWISGSPMQPLEEGGLPVAATLGFKNDAGKLVSRDIAVEPSILKDMPLVGFLGELHYEMEVERLARLNEARSMLRRHMQQDTQGREAFELAIIATRPMRVADEVGLKKHFSLDGVSWTTRAWVMQHTLRAAANSQTLLASKFVWPDALSFLLARLKLAEETHGRSMGLYAWRAVGFGPSTDAHELENLRMQMLQNVLESVDSPEKMPRVRSEGAYAPVGKSRFDTAPSSKEASWLEGDVASGAEAAFGEQHWVTDYRREGRCLARDRAHLVTGHDPNGTESIGTSDPDVDYVNTLWERAHASPGTLMFLANGVGFRVKTPLKEQVERLQKAWREEVIGRRRRIAIQRELLFQATEEVDSARDYHMALKWRVLIGAAVTVFAVYTSLVVFSLLMSVSAGSLAAAFIVIAGALIGAVCGVMAPYQLEVWRGKKAVAAVAKAAEELKAAHTDAVRHTYNFVVDGDDLRQKLRRAALERRTELLANRAWTIVKRAREGISNDLAQRRLLDEPSVQTGNAERLAREDRRDWREHAVVRPAMARIRSDEGMREWKDLQTQMRHRFLDRWRARLDAEDRYRTGFIRARVLRELVLELSQDIADEITRRLLDIVEREFARRPDFHSVLSSNAAGNASPAASRESALSWGQHVYGRIGKDWAAHAMLSATYEDDGNRAHGTFRFFARRDCHIGGNVLQELRKRRVEQITVHTSEARAPLGLFGFVFEEVPVVLQATGLAAHDLVVTRGAA